MDNDISEDFSGVFMFTNPTKKERKYLWNNKEYIFPPESTVPLIIPSETLENIQEIRKRFAFRMAEERLYEGEVASNGFNYMKAKEEGRGMPPTFDNKSYNYRNNIFSHSINRGSDRYIGYPPTPSLC